MADGVLLRLHPAHDRPALRAWFAELPQRVEQAAGDAVIYRGRNLITRHRVEGLELAVKSFGPGRAWRRGGHKGTLSYDHASEVLRRGFASPAPVAVVIGGRGSWIDHFICAYVPATRTAWAVLDGDMPDPAAAREALALHIARMHRSGIDHRDLSPGNVIITDDGSHYLVDTNRMQFVHGQVPVSRGLAALAKLDYVGQLLEVYAQVRGIDAVEARRRFNRLTLIERMTRTAKDRTRPWRRKLGL
jgi:hypothetical protein